MSVFRISLLWIHIIVVLITLSRAFDLTICIIVHSTRINIADTVAWKYIHSGFIFLNFDFIEDILDMQLEV